MKNQVKKLEELIQITEGLFSRISSILNSPPQKTLPSAQAAQNASKFEALHGVSYIVVGFPSNKHFSGYDLIKMYKSQAITNNTLIKMAKGNNREFEFKELMKREPFFSLLKDNFKQDEEPADPNQKYPVAIFDKFSNQYQKGNLSVGEIAQELKSKPGSENTLLFFDKNKYIPIKNSPIWNIIHGLK